MSRHRRRARRRPYTLGPPDPAHGLRQALSDIAAFSRAFLPHRALRPYQVEAARAVLAAVRRQPGAPRQLAWVFARQSGKDEALAQLLAFLLVRCSQRGGSIVVAVPAFRPQGLIARDRLLEVLAAPRLRALGIRPVVREGASVWLGQAVVHYVSAGPAAHARGHTASVLLVANEAQDIAPDRWDAVFAPMTAATAAPQLVLGTPWTSDGLLARQLAYLEGHDPAAIFRVPWRTVAALLPAYGQHVAERIAQLGPDHPFIRTEYELVPLDDAGRLFPPERLALMQGTHPALERPQAGERYALLIDVAGAAEADQLTLRADPHSAHDATAVTIVRLSGGAQPVYEVVRRYLWNDVAYLRQIEAVLALAQAWRAVAVVVDATGLGAGLAAALSHALPARVHPFTFTLASKSALAWSFIGLIERGRYRDYDAVHSDPEAAQLAQLFWQQARACRYRVLPGPNRLVQWGAPPGQHDDLLVSAALVAALDELDWRERVARGIVPARAL